MKTIKDTGIEFDYSSYDKIFELVENHFSYSNQALKEIKEEMYNQTFDDIYFSLLKDNGFPNDLRIRLPVSEEFLEKLDNSFVIFKRAFRSFMKLYNISYNDYRSGYVSEGKEKVKLLKVLKKFYKDKAYFSFDFVDNSYTGEDVEKIIAERYDIIVGSKISNKNIPTVVISFNYADWFLASTRNSWESCLNLESDYEYSYWTGLPSTFLDKNRCIIYSTNGTKKYYNGIESEKALNRSWGMLDEDNNIIITSTYPSTINFNAIMRNNINIDIISSFSDLIRKQVKSDVISKHEFPILNNKEGYSQFIYLDDITVIEKSKKFSYFSGASNFYYFSNDILHRGNGLYDFVEGLNYLIENNLEISEAQEPRIYCEFTDESYPEDEITYLHDGTPVAIDYYDEHFVSCIHCGNEHDNESDCIFYDGHGEPVCESCLNSFYVKCEYDQEFYEQDEVFTIKEGDEEFYVYEDNIKSFLRNCDNEFHEIDGIYYSMDMLFEYNGNLYLKDYAYLIDVILYNDIPYSKEDCVFSIEENRYITPKEIEEINDNLQYKLFKETA